MERRRPASDLVQCFTPYLLQLLSEGDLHLSAQKLRHMCAASYLHLTSRVLTYAFPTKYESDVHYRRSNHASVAALVSAATVIFMRLGHQPIYELTLLFRHSKTGRQRHPTVAHRTGSTHHWRYTYRRFLGQVPSILLGASRSSTLKSSLLRHSRRCTRLEQYIFPSASSYSRCTHPVLDADYLLASV